MFLYFLFFFFLLHRRGCSGGTVMSGLEQEEPNLSCLRGCESLCFYQVHRVGVGREKGREEAPDSALKLMEVIYPTHYLAQNNHLLEQELNLQPALMLLLAPPHSPWPSTALRCPYNVFHQASISTGVQKQQHCPWPSPGAAPWLGRTWPWCSGLLHLQVQSISESWNGLGWRDHLIPHG